MFVKLLNQETSGQEFVIEMTTQDYADRANRFLAEMEHLFFSEGLDINELYENKILSEIVSPLYGCDQKAISQAYSDLKYLLTQYLECRNEIRSIRNREVELSKSARKRALTDLSKLIKWISSERKSTLKVISAKDVLDFQITVILICQAMKQRRFVCSGRYIEPAY